MTAENSHHHMFLQWGQDISHVYAACIFPMYFGTIDIPRNMNIQKYVNEILVRFIYLDLKKQKKRSV